MQLERKSKISKKRNLKRKNDSYSGFLTAENINENPIEILKNRFDEYKFKIIAPNNLNRQALQFSFGNVVHNILNFSFNKILVNQYLFLTTPLERMNLEKELFVFIENIEYKQEFSIVYDNAPYQQPDFEESDEIESKIEKLIHANNYFRIPNARELKVREKYHSEKLVQNIYANQQFLIHTFN